MSKGEKVFSILIKLAFIAAFAAFLWASLRHIAVFFHDFEPSGDDWTGSYMLAWAIDGTALTLTIGMMFFGKTMTKGAKFIVWGFILFLTVFSWVVNWEYAQAFQGPELTAHLDHVWTFINPILASSFAALNVAYSIVSEFFGTKPKTEAELRAEYEALTGARAELEQKIRDAKKQNSGPSVIEVVKQKAIEAKKAAKEVLEAGNESIPVQEDQTEQIEDDNQELTALSDLENVVNSPISLQEVEEDKLSTTLKILQQYPAISDEELAQFLMLKRPASARFWRLKAIEILAQNHQPIAANFETKVMPEREQSFDQEPANIEQKTSVDADTGDLIEQDKNEPITDPEIEAVSSQELPENQDENIRAESLPETSQSGTEKPVNDTQTSEAQNNMTSQSNDSPKHEEVKKIGLAYKDAAKLPACKSKGITAAEIRAAVSSKKLRTYKDGSVSKSAVEDWAKTFTRSEQKEPAISG